MNNILKEIILASFIPKGQLWKKQIEGENYILVHPNTWKELTKDVKKFEFKSFTYFTSGVPIFEDDMRAMGILGIYRHNYDRPKLRLF
jgi:hypothetical protein